MSDCRGGDEVEAAASVVVLCEAVVHFLFATAAGAVALATFGEPAGAVALATFGAPAGAVALATFGAPAGAAALATFGAPAGGAPLATRVVGTILKTMALMVSMIRGYHRVE